MSGPCTVIIADTEVSVVSATEVPSAIVQVFADTHVAATVSELAIVVAPGLDVQVAAVREDHAIAIEHTADVQVSVVTDELAVVVAAPAAINVVAVGAQGPAGPGQPLSADKLDTATITFGSTSPIPLVATGEADIIDYVDVIIDAGFDGAPTLTVGVAGNTSKYAGTDTIDLTADAGTVFQIHPGLDTAGAELIIATYVSGGATVGAARVIVHSATPA